MKHCNLNEELDDRLDCVLNLNLNSGLVSKISASTRLHSRTQIDALVFDHLYIHLSCRLFHGLRKDIELKNKDS